MVNWHPGEAAKRVIGRNYHFAHQIYSNKCFHQVMETSLSTLSPHVKPLIFLFNNEPKTMEEIVNVWIIYRRPREPRELHALDEQAIMQKHLDFLMAGSRVVKEDGRYYRITE